MKVVDQALKLVAVKMVELVAELAAAQDHLTTKNLEVKGPHPQAKHLKIKNLIKIRTKRERIKKKERIKIKNGLKS